MNEVNYRDSNIAIIRSYKREVVDKVKELSKDKILNSPSPPET